MPVVSALKRAAQFAAQLTGHEIKKLSPGKDVYADLAPIFRSLAAPTIFDVGANRGQTVDRIREVFPRASVHAFEPGTKAFSQLRRHATSPGIVLNNCGLGSAVGTTQFYENSESNMSSFLELGPDGWGTQRRPTDVKVETVDHYCETRGVGSIDLLKMDTQGSELEILKGATQTLEQGRITAVYLEINFSKLYERQPTIAELYQFLTDRRFELVTFYSFHYRNGKVGWTDALFQMERAAS